MPRTFGRSDTVLLHTRVRGIRRVKVRTNPVRHVRTCMIVRVKLRVMRARRNGMHRKRMAQMRRTGESGVRVWESLGDIRLINTLILIVMLPGCFFVLFL